MTYTPSIEEQVLRKRFGKRVAAARKAKGLTQEDLAEMLGVKGAQTVSNWENGAYFPKQFDTVVRIADCLGCDIDYLTGRLEERTHDIHFVHEYTGLSEPAIEKIICKEANHSISKLLSRMIESNRFENLITTYGVFLGFLDKLTEADLDEQLPWYELNGDNVVLGINQSVNHFKQEVTEAMIHVCEDNYTDKISQIIQEIPVPFMLSQEPGRTTIHRLTDQELKDGL